MTYFPDLAPCEYFRYRDDVRRLVAVGWLDADHSFPTCPINHDLVVRLFALAVNPWAPNYFCGYHACELCHGPEKTGTVVTYKDQRLTVGASNLLIPGQSVVYATPSLVLHYIVEHHYQPPGEFEEGARSCPRMRTPEYFSAIERNGPGWLAPLIHRTGAPPN